jgi:hypothetical protein
MKVTFMYRTRFLFALMLCSTACYSQAENKSIVLKIDGYMIDFSGQIVFQPCEDDSIGFWESLDGTSFNIWCNQITDRYCESFEGLGNTTWVVYTTSGDTIMRYGYLRYFHCMVKISLSFVGQNPNDFKVYDVPRYEIIQPNKKYPLEGFYCRGILKEVIPTDSQMVLKMYEFYEKNNYTVPPLLDSIVKKK